MTCAKCEQLKDSGRILYEDERAAAILVNKPAAKGHVVVIPRHHVEKIEELDDDTIQHLFYIANYSASALFETIGAQGTNIISNEDEHFSLHIIARKQDDGLNFSWQPKQLPQADMDFMLEGIKSKIVVPEGKAKEPQEVNSAEPEKITEEEGERNYQTDFFNRIP